MRGMFGFVFFFVVAAAAASPAGTGFSGLEAVKMQPDGKSTCLVEIRGERGEPQPKEWILLFSDASARGGVREVTVGDGKITSERTPLRGMAGIAGLAPIAAASLAFDSDKVFRAVQAAATKKEIGFHWIDYTLRSDSGNRAPVWNVKLFDHMGAPVGTIRISAADGSVVSPLEASPVSRSEPAPPERPMGGILGHVSKAVGTAAKSTKDSTLHFIGSVQEELVGERTIGPKEEQ